MRRFLCTLGLLLWGIAVAQAAPTRSVLVLGDSLSAAHNIPVEAGWVHLLGARLGKMVPPWRVVNASISGETSLSGRNHLPGLLRREHPAVVVIELGANDALRGLPLRQTRRNLAYMIGAAQGIGAKVLLVGMRMPPNYGADYTASFEAMYRDLSARFDTALLPFLLQPVAADRANFQDDNLHPVAAAEPAIRDHVWTALAPLLAP